MASESIAHSAIYSVPIQARGIIFKETTTLNISVVYLNY